MNMRMRDAQTFCAPCHLITLRTSRRADVRHKRAQPAKGPEEDGSSRKPSLPADACVCLCSLSP
jgi:hypothetical protein